MRFLFEKVILVLVKRMERFARSIKTSVADLDGILVILGRRWFVEPKKGGVAIGSDTDIPRCIVLRFNRYGNGVDLSFEHDQIDIALKAMGYEIIALAWEDRSVSRRVLAEKILEIRPSLVVFSSYLMTRSRIATQPSIEFVRALKSMSPDTKMICLWWDTCSNSF